MERTIKFLAHAGGPTASASDKELIGRLEADVELARTSLAQLEADLDANPHGQNALDRFRTVYRALRSDPDQAEAGITAMRQRLAKVRESAGESLQKRLDQLEQALAGYDQSITASRELLALVGTDAVPLNVEAWVNGAPVTDADLTGKVVLLGFWAVWCGPCIRDFPKLREWHEKYGDQGLVIIGLTDYFNYAWNAETS